MNGYPCFWVNCRKPVLAMNVLVLNTVSSSLKFQVISTDPDRIAKDADERLTRGEVERIIADHA